MPVVAVPMPSNIFGSSKPAPRKKDYIDVTFETVIEAPIPGDPSLLAASAGPKEG
jgi:hypothetical protein